MRDFDLGQKIQFGLAAFSVAAAPVFDALPLPRSAGPSCELPDFMQTVPEDLVPWKDGEVLVFHLAETGTDFVLFREGRKVRMGVQSSDRPQLRPYKSGNLRDADSGTITLGVPGAGSETVIFYAPCDDNYREVWVMGMQNVPRLFTETP